MALSRYQSAHNHYKKLVKYMPESVAATGYENLGIIEVGLDPSMHGHNSAMIGLNQSI